MYSTLMAIIDEAKDPKAQLTVNTCNETAARKSDYYLTVVRWMNDLHHFIHTLEYTSRGWKARASVMVSRDAQLLKEIENMPSH